MERRCAHNPLFGEPRHITTVDKFQGRQNDCALAKLIYVTHLLDILLSLVRTKSVGHLRDARRLIVAMSRARLGLYIFCRKPLFENCHELKSVFSDLCSRPDHLMLVENEFYPTQRKVVSLLKNWSYNNQLDSQPTLFQVSDIAHMGQIVTTLMTSVSLREAKLQEQIQVAAMQVAAAEAEERATRKAAKRAAKEAAAKEAAAKLEAAAKEAAAKGIASIEAASTVSPMETDAAPAPPTSNNPEPMQTDK